MTNVDTGDLAPSRFNHDLQGLRSVAILLVVLYHIDHRIMPGGYVGVDVFFVISGFLITSLLAHEIDKHGTVDLLRFYARRARRLLPAAIVVLMATLVIARFAFSPLRLKMFASGAAATALYTGNLWFAHISTDYLRATEAQFNPLLHYWSLCVEEQFYLLWPPLILLLLWVWGRKQRQDLRRVLIAGLSIVAALSFVLSVFLTSRNQAWAFFGTPARAWEFAIGGITALVVMRRRMTSDALANMLAAAGIACLALTAILFDERTAFPGTAALLPVLGTCLILSVSTRVAATPATLFLRNKPMQVMGDLSYSWYLWHWPVILVIQQQFEGRSVILLGTIGALLSLLLAWLTFVTVENPLRFNRRLVASNRLSIAFGLLLALAGAGAAVAQWRTAAIALETPEQKRYKIANGDVPRIYPDGCHALYSITQTAACAYGDKDSDTTIVLFGDSHAAQWFPPLEAIATKRDWRLISMTKTHCPPFVFEPYDPVLGRQYSECTRWREAMFQRIGETRPDLVIVGTAAMYDLNGPPADPATRASQELWRAGVRETLDRLTRMGVPYVVMRDNPHLEKSAPECLSRAMWLHHSVQEDCTFAPGPPALPEESIAFQEAERTHSSLDMNAVICAESDCPLERDGLVLYMDDHHLTATFSRTLAPALEKSLDSLMHK